MEKIKLVIWDLDETFWKGTLAEGEIAPVEENIKTVKELTDRGIMNSVVSKNDFLKAKNKLNEMGIWDFFVFPYIEWLPKGQLIKDLIEKMQLRDNNVLFIDDNQFNLDEAKFYNPCLNVQLNSFIPEILNLPQLEGKEDLNHTRLKQYKLLEKKDVERKSFSSNIEFLKNSKIQIRFIDNLYDNIDRLHELITRTNQLNFTKKRVTKDELLTVIKNKDILTQAIQVADKFGDYGIVGFYALNKLTNQLEHFVFSCRTLNLGIEQYIFAFLNFPKLEVVGEVTTQLIVSEKPDWIEIVEPTKNVMPHKKKEKSISILLKGGCDLQQMVHYLKFKNTKITPEFNYVKNNSPIHKEHTLYLKYALENNFEVINKIVAEPIPFIDKGIFETKVFSDEYDILVYSVLMDYTQELYQNINDDFIIAYGGYNNLIDISIDEIHIKYPKFKTIGLDTSFFNYFKDNYKHIGQISPKNFINNLSQIIKKINKPIIIINGIEIEGEAKNSAEESAVKRHILMNKYLDEFIINNGNLHLLDMRKIVNRKDILDNIRHYRREIYEKMASELLVIINKITNNNISQNKSDLWKVKMEKRFKTYAKKILRK